MHLKIKLRVERPQGRVPDWRTAAEWPDSDPPPPAGEMILVDNLAYRVVTTLRTGPTSATVYAEETFRRTEPDAVLP